ncbi:8-amino-7-oxononanoate synthase [Verticillium alfalfae VaMs.102]|uniref:8-amino-7-oxononanoate synthase n=1 Tax=Verticillium alfalfae (strain VaMs.102 / ATCC MYA-4576 / FGSC 10136) TaxID=526221 RepID=C9SCN9_VERA1|nr:8-amino-7-oxononanoate synthase [Verticillium alfalfae VaMs.102]EEY16854.1 8-amino-7-oxononanoate synthase [Verticillium alfalfae VaMs.102]
MYYQEMLNDWLKDHVLQAPYMKDEPAFYRNIEKHLDTLRADFRLSTAKPRWDDTVIDWASSDFLSLNRTGRIRDAYLKEMAKHGEDWDLSAAGSRLQYGNYSYLIEVEKQVAEFFGSETAFIGHSGFLCNVGIIGAVALPGDCYLYDELVHASTHEGMKLSRASHKVSFAHNDVLSLRTNLKMLRDEHPDFKAGTKSILILVESIYSMNGDVCPLKEFVQAAKEIFPLGNAQFVIDEAHCVGVLGPKGRGLVSMLGLEKEIAIRVHMCSKAMASTGGKYSAASLPHPCLPDRMGDCFRADHIWPVGLILCNKTIRAVIMNQMRFAVYSGAPSFPMVASIRAGIELLSTGATITEQQSIQDIVTYFFEKLTNNVEWQRAKAAGLLSCPLSEGWEQRVCHTHIVPIWTKPRHEQYLFFHMMSENMNAYSFAYPVVPKGKSRVRMVFHAHNTKADVDKTVGTIAEWVREMLDIEQDESAEYVPRIASEVYSMKAEVRG